MVGSGTRLRLRVSPGSARAAVVGRHGEAWKVRVAAPAERGRANEAVLDLLSDALGVPRSRLELVTGWGGRDKIVAVDGLSEDEAEKRLAVAAGAS